jgi:hypothetical protein
LLQVKAGLFNKQKSMRRTSILAIAGLGGACNIQVAKLLQEVARGHDPATGGLERRGCPISARAQRALGREGGLSMADNLQITRASAGGDDSADLEMFARDNSDKLQAMGRSMVSALYMLVRSVKLYDPDNDVFDKPLASLQETMNLIVRKDGKLDLLGVKESFYLNGMLVKVDLSALDNVRELITELRSKDVSGFSLFRSVTIAELKNFIWIFSKEQTDEAEEDGVRGRRLISIRLAKWSKLRDKLENEKDESEAKLDRKKYALTCYARAIFFTQEVHGFAATRQAAEHLEVAAHSAGLRRHLGGPPHALSRV